MAINTLQFIQAVMNDIKELVYFNQYLKLVEMPGERGSTDQGWIKYANENYQHLKDRMTAKGERYNAFLIGDKELYLNNCSDLPYFENNNLIHFQ